MSTTLLKTAPTEQLLYGRKSAAQALDLSPGAIDVLISSGELRAIRVGRRVLITAESLRRLAQAQRVEVGMARELPACEIA
jgi:excisionase family DNA binding protein